MGLKVSSRKERTSAERAILLAVVLKEIRGEDPTGYLDIHGVTLEDYENWKAGRDNEGKIEGNQSEIH